MRRFFVGPYQCLEKEGYREEEVGSARAFLAMLPIVAATAALAHPEDEFRCLLPEGCGPVTNGEVDYTRFYGCDLAPEDELLCLLPEGCDTNGDGVPDLRAGDPAPGEGASAVQYDNVR